MRSRIPRSEALFPAPSVRQFLLGSHATYRICERSSDLVRVEVLAAPGLRAGQRFLFTSEAVARMEPYPVRSR